MPADLYSRACARMLLDRLACGDGSGETITRHDPGNRSAVLGMVTVIVPSSNPGWYRALVSGERAYSGRKIRAALQALADGETPRATQREAAWILERIEAARASGDRDLDLPPHEGRADGNGGGHARRTQAVIRVDRSEAVARVPLRAPARTVAALKDAADARGMTLNAYLLSVLTAHVQTTCPEDPSPDETPF